MLGSTDDSVLSEHGRRRERMWWEVGLEKEMEGRIWVALSALHSNSGYMQ